MRNSDSKQAAFSIFYPQTWSGRSTPSTWRNQAFCSRTEPAGGTIGKDDELWSPPEGPKTPVCGCGAQYLSQWGCITSSGTKLGRTSSSYSTFFSYSYAANLEAVRVLQKQQGQEPHIIIFMDWKQALTRWERGGEGRVGHSREITAGLCLKGLE